MNSEFLSPLEEFRGVNGKGCCLTGDFNYGPKDAVKAFIKAHNGKVSSGVTKDTSVLIVGEKGNANWAHGNYGRKVELALLARKEGRKLCIIAENDFFKLMENLPADNEADLSEQTTQTPESILGVLATAKDCFDDVTNGLLPVTAPEVAEFIAFASGVFGILLDEHWKLGATRTLRERKRKRSFYMTKAQAAAAYQAKDKPVSIPEIALTLSANRPDMSSYRCSAWGIYKWLESEGYVAFIDTENGRVTRPTPSGLELGLSLGDGYEENSTFVQLNRNAQQFLLDHIEELCRYSFSWQGQNK